jgi:SAM-dependent methyltransferase
MAGSSSEYAGEGASFYDHVATGVDGDIAFYVDEARSSGSPVLELGCGTARILIPMAEAGPDVIGLDASPDMLAIAGKKLEACAPDVQSRVQLLRGDMRDFSLNRTFSLVTIPYRAFLHNPSVDDQLRSLERVREHLSEEGRLILNVFDPDVRLLAAGRWSMPAERRTEFLHPRTGNRVKIREEFSYDLDRQLVEGEFIFDEIEDTSGQVIATTHSPLTLRYIFRYEMEHLLSRSGFSVHMLFGNFKRSAFRAGGEQVWVAMKR